MADENGFGGREKIVLEDSRKGSGRGSGKGYPLCWKAGENEVGGTGQNKVTVHAKIPLRGSQK